MANDNKMYACPYCFKTPMYYTCSMYSCPYYMNVPGQGTDSSEEYTPYRDDTEDDSRFGHTQPPSGGPLMPLKDYGPNPFAINIEDAARRNNAFRLALWTGNHLQVTLMSIKPGEDIGLEIHPNLDQFIRIEAGQGIVKMGDRKDRLNFQERVRDGFAFIIPAGKWHNLINTGNRPIKLYSIYAPPQHPRGTVHQTKAAAEAAEMGRDNNL